MRRSSWIRNSLIGSALLVVVACGQYAAQPIEEGEVSPPQTGSAPTDSTVVKSTYSMLITSGQAHALALTSSSGAVPISIVTAPNVSMTVDSSGMSIPPITNTVLSFGNVKISDLIDNNLKVCGSNGKTRCGTAFIRIYTTGTPGEGLYNSADGYGVPIMAGLSGASPQVIGLEAANAVTVQTIKITGTKNVLRLSDFPDLPIYAISADLTNAGAGSYSTTLVLEYGLAL